MTQDLLLDLETNAVRQICPTGSITLIGHSTGGLAALDIAARLPTSEARHQHRRCDLGTVDGLVGLSHFLLRHRLYPAFLGAMALHTTGTVDDDVRGDLLRARYIAPIGAIRLHGRCAANRIRDISING